MKVLVSTSFSTITAFSATTLVFPKPVRGMFDTRAETGGTQLDAY